MAKPGVGNAPGVALLVMNVAGVPGMVKSTDNGTDKGRLIGYGIAVAVGAASSTLARTPWPLLGTILMCLLMLHLNKDEAGQRGDTEPTV